MKKWKEGIKYFLGGLRKKNERFFVWTPPPRFELGSLPFFCSFNCDFVKVFGNRPTTPKRSGCEGEPWFPSLKGQHSWPLNYGGIKLNVKIGF
jgi:hypothetical protein